jgi:UDP-N-acetylmuramate--alanine ligase
MDIRKVKSVYFIGVGGIGMSALARYFLSLKKRVAGYDRTSTPLTEALNTEGAEIHYEDNIASIPAYCKDPKETLVIYTPAIPSSHSELCYFISNHFEIKKRAEVLGIITRYSKGICFAGTHAKTTTSSMAAHLLKQSTVDCNAFLGGILKNYDSNLLLSDTSEYTVIEADEYDRSFHQLDPYIAVITSADPDHLDIYGTPKAYQESFEHFTSLVRSDGYLIIKKGIDLTPQLQPGVIQYTYSVADGGDFRAENVSIGNGEITFDFITPTGAVRDIHLGVPVEINVENAVAAMAAAWIVGVTPAELKEAIASFAGPRRRFDFHIKKDNLVFIDDYAHHPAELEASILSVKALYAGRKVTGVFQPHLYSRTRDFVDGFAKALSLLDELILLDIYPAREEPIEGVTSQLILDRVTIADKKLCTKEELLLVMKNSTFDIVLMLGAGDIDCLIEPVKNILENK